MFLNFGTYLVTQGFLDDDFHENGCRLAAGGQ